MICSVDVRSFEQSIPAEFRTPALDEAAEETFGHQVKDTKVAKAMKVPVPKSAIK